MKDEQILLSLAVDTQDKEALELLLDRSRWFIEQEVRNRFGRPPWCDSLLAAVLLKVVLAAAEYVPGKQSAAVWIRKKVSKAARELERGIGNCYAEHGSIEPKLHGGGLAALIVDLMQRNQSPYWEDICPEGWVSASRISTFRDLRQRRSGLEHLPREMGRSNG